MLHPNEIVLVNEHKTPTDECLALNRMTEVNGLEWHMDALNMQYRRQGGIRFEDMTKEEQERCSR